MLLAILSILMIASIGGGWWSTANNARNAQGGPVPPATTRDYILITLFFVIAVTCMFVGLWFMKK